MTLKTKGERVGNEASEIRRTCTTLSKLASDLELSDTARRTLRDAAAILSAAGDTKKREAAALKTREDAARRALEAAEAAAVKAVASWPTNKIEDKIAICLLAEARRTDLASPGEILRAAGGVASFGKHYPATARDLVDHSRAAQRALALDAAYYGTRAASRPIAEELVALSLALVEIRASDECKRVADAWRVALVQERLTEANAK